MIYTLSHIVAMVRQAMGRPRPPQPLIRDPDACVASLDSRIAAAVQQAARDVYSETPPALLAAEAKSFDSGGVYWHESKREAYSGHVLLPPDFMMLVTFEMSEWHRPVFEAINGDSPHYALTRSRFPGICGNIHRPVAAIVNLPEGRALEFHSCLSTDAFISAATYIPLPTFDPNGGINIAENCISAVISRLAESENSLPEQ